MHEKLLFACLRKENRNLWCSTGCVPSFVKIHTSVPQSCLLLFEPSFISLNGVGLLGFVGFWFGVLVYSFSLGSLCIFFFQ